MSVESYLWIAALLWALFTLGALRDVWAIEPLPPLDRHERIVRVSIVVPARDEAARIQGAIQGWLAQKGVELEVIVVDDRSTDATAEIVAALAQGDERVRLLRVAELPIGWLGKPHACQRGGEIARSEWILFTDGDVHAAPDTLVRAVAAAECHAAQHVALAPGVAHATFMARAALATFALGIAHEMARANRDSKRGGLGIGAFNLVRRDAWRAIGGHEPLAFEVVDDMHLGTLLRQKGLRTRAFTAIHDLDVDWGSSLASVVHLLEKNQFAYFGFRTPLALAIALIGIALWVAGPLGAWCALVHGSIAGVAASVAWISLAWPATVGAVRARGDIPAALCAPFLSVVMALALANSTLRTLWRGGVAWRGTLYPLDELRARRFR